MRSSDTGNADKQKQQELLSWLESDAVMAFYYNMYISPMSPVHTIDKWTKKDPKLEELYLPENDTKDNQTINRGLKIIEPYIVNYITQCKNYGYEKSKENENRKNSAKTELTNVIKNHPEIAAHLLSLKNNTEFNDLVKRYNAYAAECVKDITPISQIKKRKNPEQLATNFPIESKDPIERRKKILKILESDTERNRKITPESRKKLVMELLSSLKTHAIMRGSRAEGEPSLLHYVAFMLHEVQSKLFQDKEKLLLIKDLLKSVKINELQSFEKQEIICEILYSAQKNISDKKIIDLLIQDINININKLKEDIKKSPDRKLNHEAEKNIGVLLEYLPDVSAKKTLKKQLNDSFKNLIEALCEKNIRSEIIDAILRSNVFSKKDKNEFISIILKNIDSYPISNKNKKEIFLLLLETHKEITSKEQKNTCHNKISIINSKLKDTIVFGRANELEKDRITKQIASYEERFLDISANKGGSRSFLRNIDYSKKELEEIEKLKQQYLQALRQLKAKGIDPMLLNVESSKLLNFNRTGFTFFVKDVTKSRKEAEKILKPPTKKP